MQSETLKVLIAEDNPGLARVLSFKFKTSGFEPITCSNGGDAWKSFCASSIAAVVTDHEMPVMSGTELISRIREMDDKVPCFLVTGRQLELSRDPLVESLAVEKVFGKPFSPGTVVTAVVEAIEKRNPTDLSSSPLTGELLPHGNFDPLSSPGISGAGA